MPCDLVEKARARKLRYRAREHAKKFGPGAGDQRGKHGNHAKADAAGRWNDGKLVSTDGYVKIRVGVEHPLADPNGYAYEHLLVWVSAGRAIPEENEILHHSNEVKSDNRLGNLELKVRPDHGRHHIQGRQRDPQTGRLLTRAGRLLDGIEHNEFQETK